MRKVLITLLVITFSYFAVAQDREKGSPDLPGDLIVNIGVNNLTNRADTMRTQAFGSKSFGIYYTNRIAISPRFSFYPAIGITSEKYQFDEDILLETDAEGVTTFRDLSEIGDIDKNRLAVNYIELPVEFRFHPWRTSDGSGFFIGVGGSVGVRVESHTKLVYSDGELDLTEKQRNSYNLSTVRYGLLGRVGFRGINAFCRVYFSDLFSAGNLPSPVDDSLNPNSFTVGISFNAF
ncbi:MAG: outer membrane beta-barrel protein [Cyclobacteriaceae bacterium]